MAWTDDVPVSLPEDGPYTRRMRRLLSAGDPQFPNYPYRPADQSALQLTTAYMQDDPFGGLRREIAGRQLARQSPEVVASQAQTASLQDALNQLRGQNKAFQAKIPQIQAAAKQQRLRDALAMRRAQLGASVGTYQNPAAARDMADTMADAAIGNRVMGQNVDPRWAMGGVSVGGMGLKAPASKAPVPMDRSALADRLAELRGEGGKYAVSSLTQVTPERRAEIAAMRKAALESRGVTNLADRLSQARRTRMESNVPRMLASKSQAVRDKGNALLEAMNGGKSDSTLDMDGIIKKANAIARTYGAAAGRWYAENATKLAQDKAEMDFRANEGKLNRESNEKIADVRGKVNGNPPLTEWEQNLAVEKLFPGISDKPEEFSKKKRMLFGGDEPKAGAPMSAQRLSDFSKLKKVAGFRGNTQRYQQPDPTFGYDAYSYGFPF